MYAWGMMKLIQKQFVIANASGLHLRPAGLLAQAVAQFHSNVVVVFGGKQYNAKSAVQLLTAGIKQGDTIQVTISGSDQEQAMERVEQLIQCGLGEG